MTTVSEHQFRRSSSSSHGSDRLSVSICEVKFLSYYCSLAAALLLLYLCAMWVGCCLLWIHLWRNIELDSNGTSADKFIFFCICNNCLTIASARVVMHILFSVAKNSQVEFAYLHACKAAESSPSPPPNICHIQRRDYKWNVSRNMWEAAHGKTHHHDLRVHLLEAISLSSIAITPRFELVEKKARGSSQSQLEKNQVYKPQLSSFWNRGCRWCKRIMVYMCGRAALCWLSMFGRTGNSFMELLCLRCGCKNFPPSWIADSCSFDSLSAHHCLLFAVYEFFPSRLLAQLQPS